MTNQFKVGDKVVFDELNKGVAKEFGYQPNKSYEVVNVFPNEGTVQIVNENGLKNAFAEYRFNSIDNKPTKNQRITALEEIVAKQGEEINELKLIVEKIRKPSTIVSEALAEKSVENNAQFNVGDTVKVVANTANHGGVKTAGWHFNGQGIVNIGAIGKITSINGDFVIAEFKKEDVDTAPFTLFKRLRNDEIELVVDESPDDIIEFEGNQYKKVDREAREGDVVIIVHELKFNPSAYIKTRKPYSVLRDEMITDKDSSGYKGTFYVYDADYGRTPETVEVYELIKEGFNPQIPIVDETAELSPNQQRAEIVEKAKLFVEKHLTSNVEDVSFKNKGAIKGFKGLDASYCCVPYLNVNEEKREVHFIGRNAISNKVKVRTVAECLPTDVFNEWIGKAISLGRALGLDVSEFEQAVQPNEVVVGHIVEFYMRDGSYHNTLEVGSVTMDSKIEIRAKGCEGAPEFTPFEIECGDRIINDTNAIYGGGE